MTFLDSKSQTRLEQTFSHYDMSITVEPDYIVVDNSQNQTVETIQEIVREAGFDPVISNYKVDSQLVFTIKPLKVPEFFTDGNLLIPSTLTRKAHQAYSKVYEIMRQSFFNYPDSYHSHYDRSKANIIKCAEGLTGSALILGPGFGYDIPYEHLADQFDDLTILDCNPKAVQETINSLPLRLQKKIHVICKDLTGLLKFISPKLEALPLNLSEAEFFERADRIVQESLNSVEDLTVQKKYNLVISSMLTSQLFSQIRFYIEEVCEQRFPNRITNPKMIETAKDFMNQVCLQHIQHLAQWTQDRVYYSLTCEVFHLEPVQVFINNNQSYKIIAHKLGRATPFDKISDEIGRLFGPIRSDDWNWLTSEVVLSTKQCGTLMSVSAFYLKLKK